MITVEQLDIEQADLVLDLVTRLLEELREDANIPVALNVEKIKQGWEANQDRFTAFVALDEDEKTTLGIITLVESFAIYADGSYGVINELYILPEHRDKKIGKVLIETAKEYGRQCGWRRIEVNAPLGEKWERAVAFYLREGFAHSGPKLRFRY
ncbi:MAG: GNAT family N-acetyltransferase [candidate division Zixibacteria bacterium]|nr:GNAT family N-acetyltransferase [candidate division Zixibacteria bacterium]